MTKYLLDDRERNGRDDSDFYAIYFDTETGTIRSAEYGSTRYAGGGFTAPAEYLRDIPEEVKPKIAQAFAAEIYRRLKIEEDELVNRPRDAAKGDRLALLVNGTYTDKKVSPPSVTEYTAGEAATVIWIGAFGTFYRNGYNHPNRSNRRVGLKFDDGRVIFVALSKCKLAREVLPDEYLQERSRLIAGYGNYVALFAAPGFIQM